MSKGLGIVLLVILHVCAASKAELSPSIVWFLRLFRMPMFFIVSGLLFSPRPGAVLLERKLRSLIVPYFAFLIAIAVLVSMRSAVLGKANPLIDDDGLRDLVLGGEYLRGDFGVFWFMTCLLFTQLLFNAMIRRWENPGSWQVLGTTAAIYLAGYLVWYLAPDLRTPWALGVVPFGLPFVVFGNILKRGGLSARSGWLVCAAMLALCTGLGQAGVHFGMDLKYAEPGPMFIGIALAIAISWLFFQLMKVVVAVSWLAAPCEAIGAASMTVMFLHQFVHFSLRSVGVRSDFALVCAGVLLPMAFWIVAKRSPVASALFLGTARRIPFLSRRLTGR